MSPAPSATGYRDWGGWVSHDVGDRDPSEVAIRAHEQLADSSVLPLRECLAGCQCGADPDVDRIGTSGSRYGGKTTSPDPSRVCLREDRHPCSITRIGNLDFRSVRYESREGKVHG